MARGCSAYEFSSACVAVSVSPDKGWSRVMVFVFMLTVYITVHCCLVIIAHLLPLFLPDEALSVGSGYVRFVCVEFSVGSI